jgi:hypothetical protein
MQELVKERRGALDHLSETGGEVLIQFLFMFLDLTHLKALIGFNPAATYSIKKLIFLLA